MGHLPFARHFTNVWDSHRPTAGPCNFYHPSHLVKKIKSDPWFNNLPKAQTGVKYLTQVGLMHPAPSTDVLHAFALSASFHNPPNLAAQAAGKDLT